MARWPVEDPDYRAFRALMSSCPETLIDVGANAGQYARRARAFGFQGRIVSLEPGSVAFENLSHEAHSDPLWDVSQVAAGAVDGIAEFSIAGNEGASSSLSRMTAAHEMAAPEARTVAVETVEVRRLETLAHEVGAIWSRPALKLDTQGTERDVLLGAGEWLDEVVAVQLELSLVELYEGGWLWEEAVSWLQERGFSLCGVTPGFTDPESGRLLQFDGVLVR